MIKRARKRLDENGVKHYEIFGYLFFDSVQIFNSKFDGESDSDEVIIDFKGAPELLAWNFCSCGYKRRYDIVINKVNVYL